MNLQEKSIPELVAMIENWMLALGSMNTPWFIRYTAMRIKEAEAILQAKREAEEVSPEDLEATNDLYDRLFMIDVYDGFGEFCEKIKLK